MLFSRKKKQQNQIGLLKYIQREQDTNIDTSTIRIFEGFCLSWQKGQKIHANSISYNLL